jgi:predicted DCC family thiol-disulfide oxidoreductase YuxK
LDTETDGAVMLYDGSCLFCAASVQFILRHERRHTLRFASLQSAPGRDIRSRHPALEGVDSMVWVRPAVDMRAERVLLRSDAAIEAALYLGGAWRIAAVGRLLPRRVRDALYDLVARHRHRLLRAPDQCYVPPPEVRARFLDR